MSGDRLKDVLKLSPLILAIVAFSLILSYSALMQFNSGDIRQARAAAEVSLSQNATTSKFVTYNGTKYGTTIQYPSSWKVSEDATGVWFISPVDETGNVRIESLKAINGSLPLTVQAQLIQSKQSYKEFNIVSSNSTILDGLPANRTDYKFKVEIAKFLGSESFDYTGFQISALKGDRIYTFTYFSTPENFHLFLPIVHKMFRSIKIL